MHTSETKIRAASEIKKFAESTAWGGKIVLLIALLLLSSSFAFAGKKSKDLEDLKGDKKVDVIIQYAEAPGDANVAKANKKGASFHRHLGIIKSSVFTVRADKLDELLESDPDITYVSPDRPIGGAKDNAQAAIGADIARSYGWSGNGVGVAIIDSGLTGVADFTDASGHSRIVYAQNFVPSSGNPGVYGHGTHVAGIIGGAGYSSNCSAGCTRVYGVAPGVNFIDLKVLDGTGAGTDSAVIAAIQRAIELKNTYNIRVINLSLGRGVFESYKTDPLTQAVESAWKAGIVVVVAAGNYGRDNSNNNNGYGTITSPGNDPYVITVGAMNTKESYSKYDDVMATYSSKGPTLIDHVVKPDLVAPGNKIVSNLSSTSAYLYNASTNGVPVSYYKLGAAGTSPYYFRLSGTSMAAPMVSGAAALLLEQNGAITPDQVKARLMKTAWKGLPAWSVIYDSATKKTYYIQDDIFTVGAGYLDIAAALASNDTPPALTGIAKSPLASVNSYGEVHIVKDSSVLWGNSVLWGTSVVWGTSVIWGTNVQGESVLWGTSVIWGSSSTQGYSVLWGTSAAPFSVLWGTASTTADSVIWGTSQMENGDDQLVE